MGLSLFLRGKPRLQSAGDEGITATPRQPGPADNGANLGSSITSIQKAQAVEELSKPATERRRL